MRVRSVAVPLALVALLAACTKESQPQAGPQTQVTAASNASTTKKPADTQPRDPEKRPTETKRKKGAKPYTEQLELSIEDIQAFWETTLPDVYGQKYKPIPDAKIMPATEKNPAPACVTGATPKPDYDDIKGNAFYCPLGQYIAFDDQTLFPDLYEKFGEFAISMVLAHEWGHAVQDQIGIIEKYDTIKIEQQADCFAGAWTAHLLDGSSSKLQASQTDLAAALGGMLAFKDPVGTDPKDESAHGSGFDRINAFQEGVEQGAARCADYENGWPEIVLIPFSEAEISACLETIGREPTKESDLKPCVDSPYDDTVSFATVDLNEYWTDVTSRYGFDFVAVENRVRYSEETTMPSCGGEQLTEDVLGHIFFCFDDNYVGWDDIWLEGSVHTEIGDFAVAVLLAKQWAVSFQRQEGLSKDHIESKKGELQQSCFAGAWAGDLTRGGGKQRSSEIYLQPGDVDEAILAFIAFGDPPDEVGGAPRGTAFEHAQAFRDGFFNDIVKCDQYS